MLFKIKAYFRFLIKSTNQHGVHSPFVYDLVTKCFYNKEKRASYKPIRSLFKNYRRKTATVNLKTAELLNRLPIYLNYKKIAIVDNTSDFVSKILSQGNNTDAIQEIDYKQNDYDLIYVNLSVFDTKLLNKILSKTHNNSLLIFSNIYQSKDNAAIWEKIKTQPTVKVTIDTFVLGYVFLRKEQVKQHFTIRV